MSAEVKNTEVMEAPQSMELRLINPTEGGFLQKIQWNREELEEAVNAKIAAYENVVYSEENMKQAKEDRAELNKVAKAIDDCRKRVKNEVMKPYTDFENEIKLVLEKVKTTSNMIDSQIKSFEEQQKEEKKQKIRDTYDKEIGELQEIVPFEKIFDSKWLNVSCSLAKAQKEIKEKIQTISTDLETIDSIDSKYKLNAKDVYINTFNLSAALAENKRLVDLEEKLEADKRRKEAEEAERKRLEEERQKAETEKKETEVMGRQEEISETEAPIPQPVQETIEKQQNESTDNAVVDPFMEKKQEVKRFKTRFVATGTREQLERLVQFMKDNNIEYGRI